MKTINLVLLASALLPSPAFAEIVMPRQLQIKGFVGVVADTGDVILAGQPDPGGLAWAKAEGVTTVITLRTAAEMDALEFDESAVTADLGLAYVSIPLARDGSAYTPEAVTALNNVLRESKGRVLLHCGSARRVSYLWAAHLYRNEGYSLAEALEHAKSANFGTLPLEGLLGEDLSELIDR